LRTIETGVRLNPFLSFVKKKFVEKVCLCVLVIPREMKGHRDEGV